MSARKLIAFFMLLLAVTQVWAPPFGRYRPTPPPHYTSSPLHIEPPPPPKPSDQSPHIYANSPFTNPTLGEGFSYPKDFGEWWKNLEMFGTKKDWVLPLESDSKPTSKSETVYPKEPNRLNTKQEFFSKQADALGEQVRAAITADEIQERPTRLTVKIAMDGRTIEQTVDIPQWEFFKVERAVVQRRMSKAFAEVPQNAPIFFTALPTGMSTSDLLPGRVSARTFDNSPRFSQDHIQNFENVKSLKLDKTNTKIFNFVGPSADSSGNKVARWEKLRELYNSAANRLGLNFGSDKTELMASLAAGNLDVIVIVAHGDKSSIYLPDGTSVTVDDILQLPPVANNKRAPIVVLLSCETGSTAGAGMVTIAEALMLRGRASAVFAPTREVSAGTSTVRILEEFVDSATDGKVDDWMQKLRGPWQMIVEAFRPKTWPDDGFHREKSPG